MMSALTNYKIYKNNMDESWRAVLRCYGATRVRAEKGPPRFEKVINNRRRNVKRGARKDVRGQLQGEDGPRVQKLRQTKDAGKVFCRPDQTPRHSLRPSAPSGGQLNASKPSRDMTNGRTYLAQGPTVPMDVCQRQKAQLLLNRVPSSLRDRAGRPCTASTLR